mmetsp:Transcript_9559/g.28446  ORF Transcript_9559/g.28446 Transcript_9559/m.28446 type:complete len:212 (-) Transcript_9559:193-828(-)
MARRHQAPSPVFSLFRPGRWPPAPPPPGGPHLHEQDFGRTIRGTGGALLLLCGGEVAPPQRPHEKAGRHVGRHSREGHHGVVTDERDRGFGAHEARVGSGKLRIVSRVVDAEGAPPCTNPHRADQAKGDRRFLDERQRVGITLRQHGPGSDGKKREERSECSERSDGNGEVDGTKSEVKDGMQGTERDRGRAAARREGRRQQRRRWRQWWP